MEAAGSVDQQVHALTEQIGAGAGGVFAASNVGASQVPTVYDATSYKEVVNRLNSLWADKMREVESLTEDHWKSQEFPLARIKKIMRMDEDVKMISTEVPVMFSKILEIFITELTMRSWLHTEESKRRTVQRSDIAMAITKNDMFDFLIDIVPREEIQLKTKTHKDGGESLQLLPPDMLQEYIQQVIAQTFASIAATEGEEGGEGSSSANTMQQLQLIQQLAQLQQAQLQDQQQQEEEPVGQVVSPSGTGHYDTSGVDIQVLQSSATTSANPLDGTTVGGALDKIAKSGSEGSRGGVHHQEMNYGQQTLHHVNPRGFQPQQQPQHQQQLHQQQSTIYPNDQHPHITTVVIPQPLSPAQPPSAAAVSVSSAAMVLDPASFPLHQGAHDMTAEEEGNLQEQLESLATEQFVGHHVPVELSAATSLQPGDTMREGEGARSDDIVIASTEDRLNYQGIPEGESIVRSISPIRGLSSGHGAFPADKTY